LFRGRAHDDGRPGVWSLIRHRQWFIVTGVWDLPTDLSDEDRMPPFPDMNLEVLREGSWVTLKPHGRTGGTGAGGLVVVFTYLVDGAEGQDYRFTAPSSW
jgi:hypothetical protein